MEKLRFVPTLTTADVIVSLAPLPYISRVLQMARCLGTQRIIAFGSTGTFSKANSKSRIEQEFVRAQLDAERLLRNSSATGIRWTLFRPTMIYGADADLNVTFIRTMIRRFHCFPIPFGASGMRQPVHVADLAKACFDVLENPATYGRAYNLGGGEVLLYEDMVRRISSANGERAFILPIPGFLYRLIITIARTLPRAWLPQHRDGGSDVCRPGD